MVHESACILILPSLVAVIFHHMCDARDAVEATFPAGLSYRMKNGMQELEKRRTQLSL